MLQPGVWRVLASQLHFTGTDYSCSFPLPRASLPTPGRLRPLPPPTPLPTPAHPHPPTRLPTPRHPQTFRCTGARWCMAYTVVSVMYYEPHAMHATVS